MTAGRAGQSVEYDPKKMRDVEFDLSITESTSTPAYRQMANEFLLEIWRANQISLEQMLQVGDFPFADQLLQNIQSQKEQLQNGEIPQGMSPELQAQVAAGADQQAANQLYGAMRNAA